MISARPPTTAMFRSVSSLIRTHRQAAGGKGAKGGDRAPGRSRGGLRSKTHLAIEPPGRPPRLIPTAGQRGAVPLAAALPAGLTPKRVLADKAYGSTATRAWVKTIAAAPRDPLHPNKTARDRL